MALKDFFKNSKEKKLVDELKKIKKSKVDKDMSCFAKYERMRQSWNYENNKGLYHNIKQGKYITETDIKKIETSAKEKGIFSTEIYNKYFDYLCQLKGTGNIENDCIDEYKKQLDVFTCSGNEFLSNYKIYKNHLEFVLKNNWLITKKEKQYVCTMIEKAEKELNSIIDSLNNSKKILSKNNLEAEKSKMYYLRLAEEVQNWMYGKDNFYQKEAQKVFNKYKDIYKLIKECDIQKAKEYVQKVKLDSDIKANSISVLDTFRCLSIEAYGENNKYVPKILELQEVFLS